MPESVRLYARESWRRVGGDGRRRRSLPEFQHLRHSVSLARKVPNAADLAHRKAPDIEGLGIELLLDSQVEEIDAATHRVRVRHNSGADEQTYDKIVIGTGASSVRPPYFDITALAYGTRLL